MKDVVHGNWSSLSCAGKGQKGKFTISEATLLTSMIIASPSKPCLYL